MHWLIILYFIELGYSPFYDSLNVTPENNNSIIRDESVMYINLSMEIELFKYIFVGGMAKNYFQRKDNNYSFHPFEVDYLFKAGLRYKNIELGFRHFCLHPVRPYEMYYHPQGSTDSSYEEFYIRISNEY